MSNEYESPYKSVMEEKEIDLRYFMRLQDLNLSDAPIRSAEIWDRRADAWGKDYNDPGKMKTEDRIQATMDYLQNRGLLGPDCDVVDVGCGPGRFVAAFARSARHVTGIDLSEKMIQYGSAYAKRKNLHNVSFRVCDFQTLDIERENLTGRFDLVFSSITPAIHGMNGLEKSMRMSRKYCCNISYIHSENELEHRIMREVFKRDRPVIRDGHWFYSLFNVLFLMGYYPEATYYKRHSERDVSPEPDYAGIFMEHMLPPQERTRENEERICNWMRAHSDADGLVTEVSDIWYGRLLWDVREKTERPAYRPAE